MSGARKRERERQGPKDAVSELCRGWEITVRHGLSNYGETLHEAAMTGYWRRVAHRIRPRLGMSWIFTVRM